jgi:SAM-dependent methyltransferase
MSQTKAESRSISYRARYAELYDRFYAEKPYREEARFVDGCFRDCGLGPTSRLLELACGTGTHALCLSELGYAIMATDNSPDLLQQARHKIEARNAPVRLALQDMCTLDLNEPPFDGAYCLFDAIGYVRTNDNVHAVLEGVNRHLRPGGVFVVEFWHAAAMLGGFSPLTVRRLTTDDGSILRLAETTIQPGLQLATVAYSIYELQNDGTYDCHFEDQTVRYFLVQEMDYMLRAGGFEPLHWFAGFDRTTPIGRDTWHIVAAARKLQPATAGSANLIR